MKLTSLGAQFVISSSATHPSSRLCTSQIKLRKSLNTFRAFCLEILNSLQAKKQNMLLSKAPSFALTVSICLHADAVDFLGQSADLVNQRADVVNGGIQRTIGGDNIKACNLRLVHRRLGGLRLHGTSSSPQQPSHLPFGCVARPGSQP